MGASRSRGDTFSARDDPRISSLGESGSSCVAALSMGGRCALRAQALSVLETARWCTGWFASVRPKSPCLGLAGGFLRMSDASWSSERSSMACCVASYWALVGRMDVGTGTSGRSDARRGAPGATRSSRTDPKRPSAAPRDSASASRFSRAASVSTTLGVLGVAGPSLTM